MAQLLRRSLRWPLLILLLAANLSILSRSAEARDFSGGGFESRMENLQGKFINVLLPLVSILGLVYAGMLAAAGNEAAKGKITFIIIGSIIGFLSPHIIGWIKAILN